MIQLMETPLPISIKLAKNEPIYRSYVQYSDVKRRNLNYSMWRAQYNAVTEIHMHTPEGGCLIHCYLELSKVVRI